MTPPPPGAPVFFLRVIDSAGVAEGASFVTAVRVCNCVSYVKSATAALRVAIAALALAMLADDCSEGRSLTAAHAAGTLACAGVTRMTAAMASVIAAGTSLRRQEGLRERFDERIG